MAEKAYIERSEALEAIRNSDSLHRAYINLARVRYADVRPVVRCRDCKHNMANISDIQDGININENWNACQLTELYDSVKPDDFCSHGVKMEER